MLFGKIYHRKDARLAHDHSKLSLLLCLNEHKLMAHSFQNGTFLKAMFPLSCAAARPRSWPRTPAQYFPSAAHCISIDKTN